MVQEIYIIDDNKSCTERFKRIFSNDKEYKFRNVTTEQINVALRNIPSLIIINEDNEWECPNCGNKDHNKMSVVRRTCGYLGENFWNVGKTKEIKQRVLHL